jgi:hypothetical protein
MHKGWNLWYGDLLTGFRGDVASTISIVEAYLAAQGIPVATP